MWREWMSVGRSARGGWSRIVGVLCGSAASKDLREVVHVAGRRETAHSRTRSCRWSAWRSSAWTGDVWCAVAAAVALLRLELRLGRVREREPLEAANWGRIRRVRCAIWPWRVAWRGVHSGPRPTRTQQRRKDVLRPRVSTVGFHRSQKQRVSVCGRRQAAPLPF